jgi:5-formyltetrahydrofolate cyclo-ligase
MRKTEARELYKQKRKELSAAQRSKLDDLMLIQLQQIELPDVHHLLSYWPIEENNEPNTHLFNGYLEFKNPAIKFCIQNPTLKKKKSRLLKLMRTLLLIKTHGTFMSRWMVP